jgi:nucleoside-diphosphate-sugar epimerase
MSLNNSLPANTVAGVGSQAGNEPERQWIATPEDTVFVSGANGFIGTRVVEALAGYGFKKIRCFVRPTGNRAMLEEIVKSTGCGEIIPGNLLSQKDCDAAVSGSAIIFHLAAGNEKSFAGCFLNSVVTTRNLINAGLKSGTLKRFLNVSSFSVYSNYNLGRGAVLGEDTPVETHHDERYDAYCFGKVKQEELVERCGREQKLPYAIVRPGAVYGPGARQKITPRVGIDTFGVFLHLGGGNRVPLTYVDNCAEAIVYAGLAKGAEGQIFNIVDDDLPSSRQFLRMYRSQVRKFRSISVPYFVFYLLCWFWERYAAWSRGQLPPVFNRRRCAAYWRGNQYSNQKLKDLTGWQPKVNFAEACRRYFDYMKTSGGGIR